ncbi:MAG TPA: TolC family protein [Bryobacteraceae bacterium]|jgi:outer membrane protein TolC|nr:TolC family protein [Bryobacteraceae bacterium]
MTKRDCALLPFALGSILLAQAPPPQGTPAAQLPLSGRGAQGGSVNTVQTPVPGLTSSTNTINTTVQVEGPYAGSMSGAAKPFSGKLSLREAVGRALEYNLGTEGLTQAMRQARGQAHVARSSLLPNVNGYLREAVEQENLEALGFRFHINFPGISIPTIVGPFNYYDLRATLTQTVADLTALNNYRSAQELVKANEAALRDARDLVVLAAGGAYLQVQAAGARVRSAQAQIDTAQALFKQTLERRAAGLNPQIDVNRSQVQLRTEQQRLMSLQNDLAKQKINLARVVGLPVNDNYEITDEIPYSPAPDLSVEQALKQAYENRADLESAQAQVRAAERARSAAHWEHAPSLALSADYGAIGVNPGQSHGTFTVVGTLRIPIWQGGRVEGETQEADAVLGQRRAELEDVHGRIEADVRDAFLDLKTAASQMDVARENQKVARDTLALTRQRFDAGIADAVEVTQSQESVVSADLDYITSVFAHNLSKVALARAIGKAEEHLAQFLQMP